MNVLISILAPRAGRDLLLLLPFQILIISILAPRAGRDVKNFTIASTVAISILAPRAGRDEIILHIERGQSVISIRAPRAGRDLCPVTAIIILVRFQSARPVRGATRSH